MSSLRNAVKRITHKERSQPQSRQHLGILEKKKDYVLRAKDYHRKEDKIKSMRSKASNKNPDEFYFNMHKSQMDVEKGKHKQSQEAKWEERLSLVGADAVKVMKSQDLSYVRMMRQKDLKSVEKMKSNLHFIGHFDDIHDDDDDETDDEKKKKKKKSSGHKRKHTIFVKDEKEAETFDIAKHFDTVPEMVGRAFNRPRISTLTQMSNPNQHHDNDNDDNDSDDDDDEKKPKRKKTSNKNKKLSTKQQLRAQQRAIQKIAKSKAQSYAELEAKTARMNTLKRTEDVLMTERNMQSKGRKRMVQGANLEEGTPAVYRWRRKRSR